VQIGTTATTNFSDINAAPSTTYNYTVTAADAAGNVSAASNTASATTPADATPPSAPTGLTGASNSGGTQVNLSWNASSDNVGVTGYRVWRNSSQIGTTTTTAFSDSTVAAGASYTYVVTAQDAAGNVSGNSNSFVITTPATTQADVTPPSAPANLTANAVGSTQVQLSWTTASDNVGVAGYQIWRNGAQISVSMSLSFTDTTVQASTSYTYTVRAYDAAGNVSPNSPSASVTTPAPAGLVIDKIVSTNQTSISSSIVSSPISTTNSNELVLAFISADGPSGAAQTITSVTGGGLTWTLRKRSNAQAGTAEVWQAVAASPVTNVNVTAVLASPNSLYQGAITVVAFQGASIGTLGATAGASAATGAPSVSLLTTRANSWVWGVGMDWDRATARTVGSGQTKVNEFLASSGDTFWVQRQTNITPVAGASVTINDTAPTNDRWNLAIIEITPF
jgi:chitodextrinase